MKQAHKALLALLDIKYNEEHPPEVYVREGYSDGNLGHTRLYITIKHGGAISTTTISMETLKNALVDA